MPHPSLPSDFNQADSNQANQTLLYDGHCPMCRKAVETLRQWKLLNGVKALAWDDSGLHDEALANRIRSELLLRNNTSGTVVGGFSAITALMRFTLLYGWLGFLFQIPPLSWLGQLFYKTIALNRRILSPPNTGGMACSCDPPPHRGYKLVLITMLLLLNLMGCYSFVAGAQPVWLALSGSALLWNLPFLLLWLLALVLLRSRFKVVLEQSVVLMGLMGAAFIGFNTLLAFLIRLPGFSADLFLMAFCLLLYWLLFRAFRVRSQALALPLWIPMCWLTLSLGLPILLLLLAGA